MNEFGKLITEARIAKGWSQAVALKAFERIGGRTLSESLLFQLERGYRVCSSEIVAILAVLYDLDIIEVQKIILDRRVDEYTQKLIDKDRLSRMSYKQLMKKKETQKNV